MRILVADDDAQNRYYLVQVLSSQGHECVSVGDGQEALSELQQGHFDAVVSDVLMPRMDGFQLCRQARQLNPDNPLPFVFYTATYTDPEDQDFGLSLGAVAYIMKPAEPAEIAEALSKVMHRPPSALPPIADEQSFRELYNPRLVHKLEAKLLQLETTRAELRATNNTLQSEVLRRRAAEISAREVLSLVQAAISSTADGVLAVDASGAVIASNRQLLDTFGLPDVPLGRDDFDKVRRALRDQVAAPLSFDKLFDVASAAQGKPYPTSIELKGGGTVEVRRREMHIAGVSAGWVWSFTDVTTRRQAELRALELQRELHESEKFASLGALASGIAHDFNNVLMIMMSGVEFIAPHLDEKSPAASVLTDVMLAGETGAQLTRQILDFSRREKQAFQVLNLGRVAKKTMRLLKLMTPARVELHVHVKDAEATVLGEPSQLVQVILNLGANSLHAISGHGTLSITVDRKTRPGGVQGDEGAPRGEYVSLCVVDDGDGMDDATAERLFEPLFTTKPKGEGTGLGLSTVRRIVEAHHGTIQVRTLPGRGCEFEVRLPLAQELAPGQLSPTQLAASGATQILLVEPNATERQLLELRLRDCGYMPIPFASASDAIEAFRKAPQEFAAVVIGTPHAPATAVEIASVLRALRANVPVVLTALEDFVSLVNAHESAAGCVILPRPFTPEAVADALRRLL